MNGFCMKKTQFPFIALVLDDASTDGEQKVIRHYLKSNFDNSIVSGYQEWETEEANYIYTRHLLNPNCFFCVIFGSGC